MKTKVMHREKGKKRSLSETSVFKVKSNQKQGNVVELDKSSKRTKFAGSKQNGNPMLAEKAQIMKVANKRKKEQSKIVKQQSNIAKSSETKKDTKEMAKLTIVKPNTAAKTAGSSRSRRRLPYNTVNLTAEQITKKIIEIKSREVLSKRARRILGVLNKKLMESVNESEKLGTVGKKNKKIEHYTNVSTKNKQKVNDEDKIKAEKKRVQSKPQEKDEDDSEDTEEDKDDSDGDIEEDKDDSDIEKESDEDESDESEAENESVDNEEVEIDDESSDKDENEEDEEEIEEDEEDKEDVEEEDIEDEDNEEDKEDEEDEEENDEYEGNIFKNARISEVRKKEVQNKKKQISQVLDNQKKGEAKRKQYVLFVGNLPLNVTENEIKQHFLTKVDTITRVSIPTKPDKTPRGFAYVEVTNNIDFEKGLSLNHTFLKKSRINVQYSLPMNGKKANSTKKLTVAKNMKLQALRKVGKLTGGNEKKLFKRQK